MAIELKTDIDKFSYAIGMNMAASAMQMPIELNRDILIECVTSLLRGGQPVLGPEEYHAALAELQKRLQKISNDKIQEVASKNQAEAENFLAENGKKDGVITTASGLQYTVLTEGTGSKPAATDTVRVHYEGSLLNGNIFDSSIKRGEPVGVPLHQVIPGWTEGVQLMSVGSKYRFFIPPQLGYGERGAGEAIEPNTLLIFEVELLDIVK